MLLLRFQLTASRRGWHQWEMGKNFLLYFNSQPHEEADGNTAATSNADIVFQLTASRRGWPKNSSWSIGSSSISTHSLTKRLTIATNEVMIRSSGISTHSLTKRLTCAIPFLPLFLGNFNSQPHEEADGLIENKDWKCLNFNSQPHEEADSNSAQKFLVQNCFFATITYIAFSVHLSFNFLRIFSSWIYPFAGANAPEKVVCLTFALIISRYL